MSWFFGWVDWKFTPRGHKAMVFAYELHKSNLVFLVP
jgi:hypothetical protein